MYFLEMSPCSCDFIVMLLSIYVTVLAKTGLVRTKTEFNFIATIYRHTQHLSILSVSSVNC